MSYRSRSRDRRSGRFVLTSLLVLLAVWTGGLFLFADSIPDTVEDAETHTDAIVVLTGGSGRLRAGIDLLLADRGDRLFVSGVYRGVEVTQLLAVLKQRTDDIEDRISIGNAVDTIENAIETAAWMKENEYTSMRLVTAAYHMPRSLLEMHDIMPEVKIVPHPVFPDHVKQDEWWAWPGTAALTASEYNKFLIAWLRLRIKDFDPDAAEPVVSR
jgi:uncharacterized SAM-binding protein YcdF (DUF218 family)